MSLMDLAGVLILSYASAASVWTLCEARTRPVPAPDARPSALPLERP